MNRKPKHTAETRYHEEKGEGRYTYVSYEVLTRAQNRAIRVLRQVEYLTRAEAKAHHIAWRTLESLCGMVGLEENDPDPAYFLCSRGYNYSVDVLGMEE